MGDVVGAGGVWLLGGRNQNPGSVLLGRGILCPLVLGF